jgi:Tol biopolymer transport system component
MSRDWLRRVSLILLTVLVGLLFLFSRQESNRLQVGLVTRTPELVGEARSTPLVQLPAAWTSTPTPTARLAYAGGQPPPPPQGTPTELPQAPSGSPTPLSGLPSIRSGDRFLGGGSGVIAFVSNQDGNQEIYRMNLDGSELARLTFTSEDENRPEWSPDGSRLAYMRWEAGQPDLYLMDEWGAEVSDLVHDPGYDEFPSWSPDGEWVLFDSDRSGRFQLYRISLATETLERLRTSEAEEAIGSLSPDGSRLLFEARVGNSNYQIFSFDLETMHLLQLTNTMERNVRPAWSPDGNEISFISARDGTPELYLMQADGSGAKRLTEDLGIVNSPSWSPDGEWILFNADRSGNFDLYLVRKNGTGLRQLTRHPADEFNGVWQPAGN